MSDVVKLRTRAEIEEEAATWIWRMEESDPAGPERAAFEAWLRQDPRHRRAVEELGKTWEALDGLADSAHGATSGAAATPTAAAQSVAESLVGSVLGSSVEPAVRSRAELASPRLERDRRPFWFAAAALLVAALAGGALWLRQGSETQILATAVGQHRNVVLADGTTVTLNTNTIVETNLGRQTRDIHLRKGEAHFDVAHDASRPFLVHAGDAVVRAIGTGFDVRIRTDQHVDVLVTEGRVEVQAGARAAAAPTGSADSSIPVVAVRALSAGEQLSTAQNAVMPVSTEQMSSHEAWRQGAVVFDSDPLSTAIAEIQRYTDARIIITDSRIATLPVGGRFKTDDLQGFLDGLAAALPITIRRAPDGLIYIDPGT